MEPQAENRTSSEHWIWNNPAHQPRCVHEAVLKLLPPLSVSDHFHPRQWHVVIVIIIFMLLVIAFVVYLGQRSAMSHKVFFCTAAMPCHTVRCPVIEALFVVQGGMFIPKFAKVSQTVSPGSCNKLQDPSSAKLIKVVKIQAPGSLNQEDPGSKAQHSGCQHMDP